MTAGRGRPACDCPKPGFKTRDLARSVHHRMTKHLPRGQRRPVYFKRGACGAWHWHPKTRKESIA